MSGQDDEDVEVRGDDSNSTVDCGSSLDISMVKEFSETLKNAIEQGKPVVLNAEDIENADGAAMQLLYAFFQDARANGVAVSWKEPSDAVKRSADLLGMKDHLALS